MAKPTPTKADPLKTYGVDASKFASQAPTAPLPPAGPQAFTPDMSLSPDAPTTKATMSPETKMGLTTAGVNAGAGLLTGLAGALLADDEESPQNKSALPAGSPGAVRGTSGSQMSYGRASLPQRQSMALELLRSGGYK